uniref:Cystathionine gamma-lyase n=1 Tax=Mastacembelus armatus TaxID=205130 RepID=A0A3Q3NBR7_9TELE
IGLFAGFRPAFKSFATEAIHVGQEPEQWKSMAVVPPISLSTTFKQHEPGNHAVMGSTFTHVSKAKDNIFCPKRIYQCRETVTHHNIAYSAVVDIKTCADLVHGHNKDIVVVVDNTFMSAYFQRPLTLGADICMYSASKYMNGHSDVVMGLASTNRDDLYERLKFLQNALGGVPSPFDCFLCNRGLKTLQLRMAQHFKNAMAAAKFLEANPRVERVIFPALPSHPQHEVMKRQCTGCSGMITFYIKGKLEHATTFLKSLKLFAVAESLGGYESLAEHPAIMTHSSVPEKERKVLGISDTVIRLSVGLEDEADIIEDLAQALAAAVSIKHALY